jgi:hypothetical protein
MVNEISYTTIQHVLDSWESLKRTKNYEEVAGAKLFQLYVRSVFYFY